MRILKFVGAFLVTFLLIFLIVFGFNLDALYTLWDNQEGIQEGQEWVQKTSSLKGLTEYVAAQPERVSIASVAVNNPDSSILYNHHTPRTMGRLSVIFTTIEYVRQVEGGSLDPNEQVSLEEINRFQLPYMDESDHDDAISILRDGNKVSDDDFVALKDLVQASIQFNDIAIADYLLFKFGMENIKRLYDNLLLKETELPLPFSGLYITLRPNETDTSAQAHFDSLSNLSIDDFRNTVLKNARRLKDDAAFRKKITDQFRDTEGLGIKFTLQRDALAFFPKTTAHEMSNLMKDIQQNQLISKEVSQKIKSFLSWPLENESGRLNKDFATYGALYDNRMGMVNGIDYGRSSYSEEPFAQAVFFDELQIAFWFHMSSNLMHQDFEQRLIWDPALREATVSEIKHSAK